MVQFIAELAVGKGDERDRVADPDFALVIVVAPAETFFINCPEIKINCGDGIFLHTETGELGVVSVTPGFVFEDLAGKQALPPEGGQPLGVQVAGMKTPESHEGIVSVLVLRKKGTS